MKKFIKNHISAIIGLFILLGPILDLLTGLNLYYISFPITIGMVCRILFLIFMFFIVLFCYRKKKIIIPYLIIGIYFCLYLFGVLFFKDYTIILTEIQNFVKVFYYPLLMISLYSIREEIRISYLTLFTVLFLYLIFIFVPITLGVGYKSYEITKAGTLGFYHSANEISGIISILTPVLFIILKSSKKIIPKILLFGMYLTVILTIGTKTPLLALCFVTGAVLMYQWILWFQKRKYKRVIISVTLLLFGIGAFSLILPRTNFYKNIETHLDYLGIDHIVDVFEKEEYIDHFIFSQRLTFLHNKAFHFHEANLYQKLFGIGYIQNHKTTKMIEMDYFDIYYSHGLIGFFLFFGVVLLTLYKILVPAVEFHFDQYMMKISLFLAILLSLFTGHIITSPSVSFLVIIIILSLYQKQKKDILFADKNMEIGGIETAQLNLLKHIDYNRYRVTLVLEEKKGELLNQLDSHIIIREVKVSNHSNVILRKIINASRKLYFKILNYQLYDFSCCYATYSYSCNVISKIASNNNALYVHSDYQYVYPEEDQYREFFDSRGIHEFKKIIFVSNESQKSFLRYYPELKERTYVINNFIDIEKVQTNSLEDIPCKKRKGKTLFVFVGRLDDTSKKLKRAISLVEKIHNTELWIIGDGEDRKMYEDYAKGLKNVLFFGKKINPYPYMREADYIILTSDYEGFPVTYLESIALGKRIITTIPTSDDSIDMKKYAFIVSKDEKVMVDEVRKIIKENKKVERIDLESIQKRKMIKFEKIMSE